MSQPPKWTTEPSGLELDWKERVKPEERAGQELGHAGRGLPGEVRYMSPDLQLSLEGLLKGSGVSVRQSRERFEAITGWETCNHYEVIDASGAFTLSINEGHSGVGQALLRNFMPLRTVELEVMTRNGTRALSFTRPVTMFLTCVEVTAWDGRPLGSIEQRLGLTRRHFDIRTPAGGVLATIEGPLWKPWTFQVFQRGEQVATIRKHWSGFATEAFTDADDFGVEFLPGLTDGRLRQLVLAATLMVDLSYFEKRSSGNLLSWSFLPTLARAALRFWLR